MGGNEIRRMMTVEIDADEYDRLLQQYRVDRDRALLRRFEGHPPVPTGAEMDPRPKPTATTLVDGAPAAVLPNATTARARAGVTPRERAIADLVTAARRRARALEDADAERREMLEPLRVLHGLMSVAELARLIDGAGLSMTRTQLYPYLRLAGVPIGES
jgi:hypothetical protein